MLVITLLPFLRPPVPHEHEDGRLRDDEILRALERDLHRRLAKEQGVVAGPRLHRQILDVGAADLPRLVVHAGGLGHRGAGPRRHDPPTLDLARLDRGGRQIEPHVGALFSLLGRDEHPVPHDDQTLGSLVRHGLQYITLLGPGGDFGCRRDAPGTNRDADHARRLTDQNAPLLMRPRPPVTPSPPRTPRDHPLPPPPGAHPPPPPPRPAPCSCPP